MMDVKEEMFIVATSWGGDGIFFGEFVAGSVAVMLSIG